MDGGLGGAVGGGEGEGQEGEAGGDVDDGGVGLLLEWGSRAAVRRMGPSRLVVTMASASAGFGLGEEVFGAHDAGVVDDYVEGGVVGRRAGGDFADVGGVFDVELDGAHAGIGGGGLVEDLLAAAGDDDLVAEVVEGFCEAAADPEPPPVMRMVFPVGFMVVLLR